MKTLAATPCLRLLWACCLPIALALTGCQPAKPPPTPLPTKEKTIDKVKDEIDKAMKKAEEVRDAEDPMKKGY